jgi:2'-5' RNA ligase
MKPPSEIADLRRAIAALPLADFGRFVAAKHLLYQSKLGPTGSQYTVLAEFPL